MDSDPLRDPRDGPLSPTPEETEAWVNAERKRREAWLAGPTKGEKEDWTRRCRRRAALGLAESRLPPSPEEVERWAEREHKRRQAWIAGPTEDEKREWSRSYRRRGRMSGEEESSLPPSEEDVEAWADEQRRRRREWLVGPTDEERRRWARRESGGLWADVLTLPFMETELFDDFHRFLREAELAGKGSLFALARAPLAVWSSFVKAGRRFEDEFDQLPRRGRVRF